jgi:hypothetical protein
MLVILRAQLTIRGLKMHAQIVNAIARQEFSIGMSEFVSLCAERLIDPAIALESVEIRDAIRGQDTELLISILDSQF